MITTKDVMDQVKYYSREFVGKHYPDEAPYFGIAWEAYEKTLQTSMNGGLGGGLAHNARRPTIKDLRGPTVRGSRESVPRLEEDGTLMALKTIRAFHILFAMATQTVESKSSVSSRQEMLQLLLQRKFSLEFSEEIVNFFVEQRDEQVV